MTEPKFTKGKWIYWDDNYEFSDESYECFYSIGTKKYIDELARTKSDKAIDLANAQLIAAAPDLYKALEMAHNIMSNYVTDNPSDKYLKILNYIQQALSRARGE